MKRLAYIQAAAVATVLAVVAGVSAFLLINQANVAFGAAEGCACSNGAIPWWSWTASALALAFLAVLGVRVARALRAHFLFQKTLDAREVPAPLHLARGAVRLRIRLQMISDERIEAFTTGLLRTRVVMSTGLVAALSAEEQKAVLAHEAWHAHAFHPLLTFILTLGQRMLRLPERLMEYLRFLTEEEADRAALRTTSLSALRRALLKVMNARPQPGFAGPAVAAFSATELRLRSLLSDPVRLSRRMVALQGALVLSGAGLLAVAVLLLAHAPQVEAATGGMCTAVPQCVRGALESLPPMSALFTAAP
jgi:Zn-dependent protease with chaperone function